LEWTDEEKINNQKKPNGQLLIKLINIGGLATDVLTPYFWHFINSHYKEGEKKYGDKVLK